jgi:hypothetical protein
MYVGEGPAISKTLELRGYGIIFFATLQLSKQHQYKAGCSHSTLSHRLGIRVPVTSNTLGTSIVLKSSDIT